jgi:lycopene cyclase domain-containing protein
MREFDVLKFGYLAMLLFTVVGSFWLELALKVNVLRRIKRVFFSIFPVAIIFVAWDEYAISAGHWYFDKAQILGIFLPMHLPLEELLFFFVVPIAAIMTIEAVRRVKKHWLIGDER